MSSNFTPAHVPAQFGTILEDLGTLLLAHKFRLVTAESCTGGLVASTLTDLAGSSQWFHGAIVAYSNEIKQSLLQVSAESLLQQGAVSTQTVSSMAMGALDILNAHCAIATSGIAGPGGGSKEKPVGTVCIATAIRLGIAGQEHIVARQLHLMGTRAHIKQQTAEAAILQLYEALKAL